MEYKERKEIINLLEHIENNYNVCDWNYSDISLWPILKRDVFFIDYSKTKPANKKSKLFLLQDKLLLTLVFIYNYFIILIKKKITRNINIKNLFLSDSHFRVLWQEKSFNKHFDPIMDFLEEENSEKSVLLEMSKLKNKTKFYKKNRLVNLMAYYPFFKLNHKQKIVNFNNLKDYDNVTEIISKRIGISKIKIGKRLEKQINQVLVWEKIASYLYNMMNIKNIFILDYYSIPSFGFILAAKKRNIISVDMQHGGQGTLHPLYNFNNIPKEGFSVLPSVFWNWDTNSLENLSKTLSKTKKHRAILGGNVWADYLSNFQLDSNTNKKIILYSLQVNHVPVMHDYIIDGIKKTSSEYIWWLRLHPRMSHSEIDDLLKTIKTENISHKVKIDYGVDDPLPLVLKKCYAHVSHFSGCILEGSLLNIKINIVMGEIGEKFYKELILKGEAFYFDTNKDENLFTFIKKIAVNNVEDSSTKDLINYKSVIKNNFIF